MSPDILDRLRDADPAANLPQTTPDARERLRRAIVAAESDDPARAARRRRRRRFVLIAVAGGAIILLGATAVYAETYLLDPIAKGPNAPMSAEEWRAEYETWTHEISLPPGAHWRGFRNPDHAGTSRGAGHLDAVFEAMGHWTREWIAATEAGDAPRAAVAENRVVRLRATIPTITDEDTAKAYGTLYGTESLAGVDENGADYFDDAIAKAKAGDFDTLRRLVLGHTYWPTPEPTPKPSHFTFGLMSSGYGAFDDMNDYAIAGPQAWAEYQAALAAVGVPAGMDASGRDLDDPHEVAFRRDVVRKYGTPTSALPEPVNPHARLSDPRSQHNLGEGFEAAFDDLWAIWWREWAAAARADDQTRVAAASAATTRLQGLLPHTETHDGRVITWVLDPTTQRDLEQLAAQARTGDLRGIEEWLAFQVWYAWSMLDAGGYYVQ